MNTGVEILLKRMETHPEDFDYNPREGVTRWSRLVDHALGDEVVTEEEEKALRDMILKMRRDRFTEMVMKELAGVEDETSDEGKTPMSTALRSAPISGGATQGTWANTSATTLSSNSLKIGNTTLEEEQIKQIKAHLDYLNKTKVEVRKKAVLR